VICIGWASASFAQAGGQGVENDRKMVFFRVNFDYKYAFFSHFSGEVWLSGIF